MAKVVPCKKPDIWAFDDTEMSKPQQQRKDYKTFEKLCAASDKVDLSKRVIGCVVGFPYADGHAFYKVLNDNPLTLEHIPYGDAWRLAAYSEAGILEDDIRDVVQYRRRMKESTRK